MAVPEGSEEDGDRTALLARAGACTDTSDSLIDDRGDCIGCPISRLGVHPLQGLLSRQLLHL
jgi:hypothetical protein